MAEESTARDADGGRRSNAIIVDFDFVMTDGYEILEMAAENALGAHGVELTHSVFVRRLLGARATPAFAHLLPPGVETAPDKFTAQVYDAADKAVDGAKIRKSILDFLKAAEEAGDRLIFVTSRNHAVVEQKLEGAGFVEPRVVKTDRSDRFGEYPQEAWQKASRFAHSAGGNCFVLVGGAQSVKDALAIGRRAQFLRDGEAEDVILPSVLAPRVIAIVSKAAEHHDYTGADYLFDAQPGADLAEALGGVVF